MSACQGCGAPVTQPSRGGRRRKWCSERCRKRGYDLVCVDCGGRVDGTSPGRMADRNEPVCVHCAPSHWLSWTRDAIVLAIQEWADAHGGIPPSANEWRLARVRDDSTVSVETVRERFGTWNAAIRAAGFEPHAGGPAGGYTTLTAEQRAECIRRYAAGESSLSIAADIGCSAHVVTRWAARAGVPIRPRFGRTEEAA